MRSAPAMILCLATAAGCGEADLYVDGKYTCEAISGCPEGWFCMEGRCRERFDHADPGCDACVTSQCAEEAAACGADDGCRSLYACVAGCAAGDPACRMDCERDAPDARTSAVFDALDACRRRDCFDGCVGLADFYDLISQDCQRCMVDQCAGALRACYGPQPDGLRAGDCERFRACIRPDAAANPATWELCGRLLGLPELNQPVWECEIATCSDACQAGRRWRCLGGYEWPRPLVLPVEARLRVREGLSLTPLVGQHVAVYDSCLTQAPPTWEGVTPVSGVVEVALGDRQDGVDACVRVDDGLPNVGPDGVQGHMTSLYHWSRPFAGIRLWHELFVPPARVVRALEVSLGFSYDPAASQVFVDVRDCAGEPAPGVVVTAEQVTDVFTPYALTRGFPVPDLTTSPDGQYLFLNLDPGLVTLRAVRVGDGREVASMILELLPDTVHVVDLTPHTTKSLPADAAR